MELRQAFASRQRAEPTLWRLQERSLTSEVAADQNFRALLLAPALRMPATHSEFPPVASNLPARLQRVSEPSLLATVFGSLFAQPPAWVAEAISRASVRRPVPVWRSLLASPLFLPCCRQPQACCSMGARASKRRHIAVPRTLGPCRGVRPGAWPVWQERIATRAGTAAVRAATVPGLSSTA